MTTSHPTDRLLQTLRIRVAGATDDMIKLELFNTVDEFFRRTSAWQEQYDIALDTETLEYIVPVPAGSTLVRVMGVSHNGAPVPTAGNIGLVQTQIGALTATETFADGDALFEPDATDATGGLFTWALFRPGYVSVTTPPTSDQVNYPLKISAAITVEAGCLECDGCDEWSVPDWMWEMYFQDWLDGVQYRMYSMVAKPWSNAQAAVFHGKRFRNSMGFRKQETPRGFTHGQRGPWRFPRGWT